MWHWATSRFLKVIVKFMLFRTQSITTTIKTKIRQRKSNRNLAEIEEHNHPRKWLVRKGRTLINRIVQCVNLILIWCFSFCIYYQVFFINYKFCFYYKIVTNLFGYNAFVIQTQFFLGASRYPVKVYEGVQKFMTYQPLLFRAYDFSTLSSCDCPNLKDVP